MRIEDLNWMDVEQYLQKDDRLMIVLGATEEHGYLSLTTDVKIPVTLADAASQHSGVLIAPPLNFGISPYFAEYPGTISLRVTTFLDVVEDMVRSLHHQGFRRFLFLNGHGGNEPARARLTELANSLDGLKCSWYSWWIATSVTEVAMKHDLKSNHAAWIEAFPFTMVGPMPEGEKTSPSYKGILNAVDTRKVYGDGMFGGPYKVDESIMNEVFAAAMKDILFLLDF